MLAGLACFAAVVAPTALAATPNGVSPNGVADIDRVVRTLNGGSVEGLPIPGMVLVPGGNAKLGVEREAMLEMGERNRAQDLKEIMAMYPAYTPATRIDDFFIDLYETSSAEYQAYLDATHRKPGKEILEYAWYQWENGQKVLGYDAEQHGALPIRAVTLDESRDFLEWAGKRLPTEQEWEYAARYDLPKESFFPWGEGWAAWKSTSCSNVRNSTKGRDALPSPGGSFPTDKTALGLFDMAGNVSEWTTSPFLAYPGHEPIELKVGKKKETFRAAFDGGVRAIRGGNFMGNEVNCNLVFRQGVAPNGQFEALGFRGVASAVPGLDALRTAEGRDLSLMGKEVRGNIDMTVEGMAAQQVLRYDESTKTIDHGSHFVFARVQLVEQSAAKLAKSTLEEPALLGIFSTTERIADPNLEPGTYAVYLRGAGETKEQKEARKAGRKNGKDDGEKGEDDKVDEKDKADEKELTPEQKAELEKMKSEDAESEAARKALGQEKAKGIDPLDLPTDKDLLLIQRPNGEIVAFLEAKSSEGALLATTISYRPLGGKVSRNRGVGTSSNAVLVDDSQNDLAEVQFSVKLLNSGKRGPRFTLPLEFAAGTFERMDAPDLEKR